MPEYNLEAQHRKGKLHAIERIDILLDPDSFIEVGQHVTHSSKDFGMDQKEAPYDGVITGFGSITGKTVAIYAQDFTVIGGSLGKKHGEKIVTIIKKAIELRCPVIGINDSGGARIQEGINSLAGYGEIFYYNTLASGYIPQISIIAGPCAGGAVYSPGLTDFVFVIDKISNMFVTGPKVVKQAMFETITADQLGGAELHAQKSGVAHFRCATETECYNKLKSLLHYLPGPYHNGVKQENSDLKNEFEKTDEKHAMCNLKKILPQSNKKVYDIKEIIACCIDDDSFLEIHREYAKNIVVGFGRVGGKKIGVVANQPLHYVGVIDSDASIKAARFIRFCDCFDIPLITFTDVPGYLPGYEQEKSGIIRNGAKLLYAFSEATVPKINIIVRKAFGGAYIAMNSKHTGADFVFAWPNAEIAVMGAENAVEILYRKDREKISSSTEREKFIQQKIAEYRELFMRPEYSAKDGYIDAIIEPEQTRTVIIECLSMLAHKKDKIYLHKKHGNIPL